MEAKASIKPDVQLDTATAALAPVRLHISCSNRETAWPRVTVPELNDSVTNGKIWSNLGKVGRVKGIG